MKLAWYYLVEEWGFGFGCEKVKQKQQRQHRAGLADYTERERGMSESLQNNGMQWTDLETDINREYSSREKKQQVTQVDVGREPPVCSHTLQTTSTVRF